MFDCCGTQDVRLPKEFRFSEDEVYVKKIGSAVVLCPKQSVWDSFISGVNGFTDDFMEEGRDQGTLSTGDVHKKMNNGRGTP